MKLKTYNLKLIFVFFFTFYVLGFIFTPIAHAQGVSLGIFPPILEIQATTPTDIKSKILIENLSNDPVNLSIGIKPFQAADSEDGQVYYPSDYSSLLADPFIFNKMQLLDGNNSVNEITLSPQQKKELTLEIALPQGEPTGDYYFSIIFQSAESSLQNSTNTTTLGGIATNVLLSIGPKGPTNGNIEDFSAPSFITNGPVPFSVKIRNTSDHFITTKGSIVIKNMFGQAVGKVDLLPVNILSQSVRSIPDSMQGPQANPSSSLKSYFLSLKSPAAVWPETILFGPYTATLTIALSDQGPLFRRTISFYAFPLYSIIAIIIIIAIVSVIVIRVKKISLKV